MRRLVPAALCVLTTTVTAQVRPHTRTCPRAFTGWYAPGGSWLPFGRSRVTKQTWYHGTNMRKGSVTEIGWRSDTRAQSPAQKHRIAITMANTAKTFGNLDRRFASNFANGTVFKSLATIDLPPVASPTDPNRPALWIKGDRPFVFAGPHFLLQVEVRTSSSHRFLQRHWADAYLQANPRDTIHGKSGRSCGGVRMISTDSQGFWHLVQFLGKAGQPALFLIGLDSDQLAPGVRLPVDLGPIGMAGCTLNVAPLAILSAKSDSRGRAIVSIPFRVNRGVPLVVHAQGIHLDAAKRRGIATTNAVHSILSDEGLSNHLFNWTRDGASAEFGPYLTNRGVVVLLRP